jgi:hypothetical protein
MFVALYSYCLSVDKEGDLFIIKRNLYEIVNRIGRYIKRATYIGSIKIDKEIKMKQKYLLLKNSQDSGLVIKELAELEKGIFSVVYEEKYDGDAIVSAMETDPEELMSVLRTLNFYPNRVCAEKIADGIADLYGAEDKESVEVLFNDIDLLTSVKPVVKEVIVEDEVPAEIDALLEDDKIEDEVDDPDKVDVMVPNAVVNLKDDDVIDPVDEVK